jgi:sulfur relay (sulfurtransferase) DsrC/TusE family protein
MNVVPILSLPKPEVKVILCEQRWSKTASVIMLYLSNRSLILYIEDATAEPFVCQRRWMEEEEICAIAINRDNEIIITTKSEIIISTFSFFVSSKSSEHLHQLFQEIREKKTQESPNLTRLTQIFPMIPKKRFFFFKEPVYAVKGKASYIEQILAEFSPERIHLVEEKQLSLLLIVSGKYIVCWELNKFTFIRYPNPNKSPANFCKELLWVFGCVAFCRVIQMKWPIEHSIVCLASHCYVFARDIKKKFYTVELMNQNVGFLGFL